MTQHQQQPQIEDLEKQRREFHHDLLEKVDHGIVSSDGCTRFNTKHEAQLALDKVLEDWNSRKDLIINIEADLQLASTRKWIERMVDINCKQCGQLTIIRYYEYHAECNECNTKRRKREYEAYAEECRQDDERHPIIKYCNDIHGKASYWEVPFEQRERFRIEHDAKKYAGECQGLGKHIEEWNILDQNKSDFTKDFAQRNSENLQTGKITKQEYNRQFAKEWNAIQNKKRLKREERKQYDKDIEMARMNSPLRKFEYDVIGKIDCECKLDEVRLTGKICKTCKLILKVQEYTLNLFKDAAQGRMPSSGFMPR